MVRAAAILSVRGAPPERLEAAADAFLPTALSAGGDWWTTADLRRLEDGIVARATSPAPTAAGLVAARPNAATGPWPPGPGVAPGGRADRATGPWKPGPGVAPGGRADRALDPSADPVTRLTQGAAPVDVLAGPMISQAQVLEAARQAWEAAGHRVALVSPTERGQARWQYLAGLEPPPAPPRRPTVVVVDNAERWSTIDLHQLVADAAARQAKVVLLDGGSQPRRGRAESPAFETLRTRLVPIDAGPARPPGPIPDRAATPVAAWVRAGCDGSVTLAPTGEGARARLVADWQQLRAEGRRPRMVALGPEEAEHLNGRARAALVRAGQLQGPAVSINGRSFQAGDEVMALRRDPRLGAVPGGTIGRVTAVEAAEGRATISWRGREEEVAVTATGGASRGHRKPPPLAHGYATTPPYLRGGHDGVVLSLGPIEVAGVQPERIYTIAPTPLASKDVRRDRTDPLSTLLVEATGRPGGPGPSLVPDTVTGTEAARPLSQPVPDTGTDAARPLSQLVPERDRLGEYLRASAPADPGPERRRVAEDRAWLASTRDRPGGNSRATAADLVDLDARLATLDGQVRVRQAWLAQHRGQLERWADLTHAISWREAALGRGAELRPTAAVLAALGPPPNDASRTAAWRHAAAAVESHRERWQLPDGPLDLSGRAGERQAGEVRVRAATEEVRRSRGQDRALAR